LLALVGTKPPRPRQARPIVIMTMGRRQAVMMIGAPGFSEGRTLDHHNEAVREFP
jgi:hypothetical protein